MRPDAASGILLLAIIFPHFGIFLVTLMLLLWAAGFLFYREPTAEERERAFQAEQDCREQSSAAWHAFIDTHGGRWPTGGYYGGAWHDADDPPPGGKWAH